MGLKEFGCSSGEWADHQLTSLLNIIAGTQLDAKGYETNHQCYEPLIFLASVIATAGGILTIAADFLKMPWMFVIILSTISLISAYGVSRILRLSTKNGKHYFDKGTISFGRFVQGWTFLVWLLLSILILIFGYIDGTRKAYIDTNIEIARATRLAKAQLPWNDEILGDEHNAMYESFRQKMLSGAITTIPSESVENDFRDVKVGIRKESETDELRSILEEKLDAMIKKYEAMTSQAQVHVLVSKPFEDDFRDIIGEFKYTGPGQYHRNRGRIAFLVSDKSNRNPEYKQLSFELDDQRIPTDMFTIASADKGDRLLMFFVVEGDNQETTSCEVNVIHSAIEQIVSSGI